MRFNGVDILQAHRALSINKEIPPGMPGRDVETVSGTLGEIVTGVNRTQDEYLVRVNIAARSRKEAWDAREALAAWAMSSGNGTGELEPTNAPGKAYSAIVKTISRPEFVFGFATLDVTFLLPVPVMHDVRESRAVAGTAAELRMAVGGTSPAQPTITYTCGSSGTNLLFTVDGANMLRLKGSFTEKQVIVINLQTGEVTIDGAAAADRLVYTDTDLDVLLHPGRHTIGVNRTGTLEARWRNQWA